MIKTLLLILVLSIFTMGCSSKNIDNRCLQKPKKGKCKAKFKRYYFDNQNNKCETFFWGGCGGVVPFKTIEECKKRCIIHKII